MVVEEKTQRQMRPTDRATPSHVNQILKADEAQLDALTNERKRIFIQKPQTL